MISKYKYTLAIIVFTLSFGIYAQQGTVTVNQSEDITKLLEYKKDIETLKLYKIQVYNNADPDYAQSEKSKFLNSYSEWPVEIQWESPNYKVWVGNFASRIEAERALVKIKKKYMYAFIIKPREDKKKRG